MPVFDQILEVPVRIQPSDSVADMMAMARTKATHAVEGNLVAVRRPTGEHGRGLVVLVHHGDSQAIIASKRSGHLKPSPDGSIEVLVKLEAAVAVPEDGEIVMAVVRDVQDEVGLWLDSAHGYTVFVDRKNGLSDHPSKAKGQPRPPLSELYKKNDLVRVRLVATGETAPEELKISSDRGRPVVWMRGTVL